MILPKLIITDIDGVWTDGSMYYTEVGDELKRFHTADGAGVKYAQWNGIPVAIMTGESTKLVEKRAAKLKVDHLYQGVSNKLELAQKICTQLQISLEDCAFIGDDLNDYLLAQKVGLSACPSNAHSKLKEIVHKVFEQKGGTGVFRSFVEWILSENNLLEATLQRHINP